MKAVKKALCILLAYILLQASVCTVAQESVTFSLRVEGIYGNMFYRDVAAPPGSLRDAVMYADSQTELLTIITADGGYITEINGEAEGRFGEGDGWAVRRNGVQTTLAESYISDGDEIVIYYGCADTFQFPRIDASKISDGIITVTSEDTVILPDGGEGTVINPVVGAVVRWTCGSSTVQYVTDDAGRVSIPASLLTPGPHALSVEKTNTAGAPVLLRTEPGYTVSVLYPVSEHDVLQTVNDVFGYKMAACGVSDYQALANALAQGAGVSVTEWYIIALAALGRECDFSAYINAASAVTKENGVEAQRVALALAACSPSYNAAETVDATALSLGLMSRVHGLLLLDCGRCEAANVTPHTLIGEILDMQHEDGGWAAAGSASDVDATAMTLVALSAHTHREDVHSAVLDALSYLSLRQNADGGFSSWGEENPESASQVIIALCSLNIDPRTDERFIKNSLSPYDALLSYKNSDGGFSHTASSESDERASSQALLAAVSLYRLDRGLGSIYSFVTAQPPMPDTQPQDTAQPDVSLPVEQQTAAVSTESEQGGGAKTPVVKIILCSLILCLSCAVMFALHRAKRLSGRAAVAILLLAAGLLAAVIFINLQSTDEFYGEDTPLGEVTGTVKISVSATNALGKTDVLPADGFYLHEVEVHLYENDTVYDLTRRILKKERISFDCDTPSPYVRGIGQLYEFDISPSSGWMYYVNGVSPAVGCGAYTPVSGDRIEWVYVTEYSE